jgi:hypothetical protein
MARLFITPHDMPCPRPVIPAPGGGVLRWRVEANGMVRLPIGAFPSPSSARLAKARTFNQEGSRLADHQSIPGGPRAQISDCLEE